MADTKPQQGWKEAKAALHFFVDDFLKGAVANGGPMEEGDIHVMYAFGTMIRITIPDDVPPDDWQYDPSTAVDYPTHRFKSN